MPDRPFDAIICDIDGCLGPERHDPLDAAALATIAEHNRRAQEDGDRPVVTLCSGRPLPYVESMCRLIGNRTIPVIGEMGVWLWHPDSNHYDRDPAITADHIAAVHEAEAWLDATFGPDGVSQQPGKSCSISIYHPNTRYLKGLAPQIRDEFDRRGWPFRVSSTWLWINCDLEHVSKATGIERMMAHTGLTKDRLAGIGDTSGDLAIREHVARFGCPANAADELKPHADIIAESPEIEGVLELLRDFSGERSVRN